MDRTRLTRWLIPLPAILFALIPQNANAEPISGLEAVGYTITDIPPVRSDDEYVVCYSELENNINRNFDGEPFGDCPTDLFMIHYTGFIEIPENDTIQFMVAADDGGTMKIGLTEFGDWNDKGCSWSEITSDEFPAGVYALDGWYYEHGGNACFMLAWNIDDEGWVIVPDEAFTTNGASATTSTTSTSTTTTTSSTTTLPQETTTTSEQVQTSTTTSVANTITSLATTTTTTTQQPSTPTQTTSTTDQPVVVTSTSVFVPEPQPEPEPETTTTETTSTTTTTTTSLPTTTTTLIEATTSVQDTSTTVVESETTVLETTTTVQAAESTTTSSQPLLDASESTVLGEITTTLALPQTDNLERSKAILEPAISIETNETGEISPEVFNQILDEIADAEPEKVVAIVEAILATNISQQQAVELVVSPVVLEAVTEEQAEAIFETIVPEQLTEAQAEEISEVLSEAPTKVKKAFQNVIDIFGSQFESYVPTGSNIPVSQRRSLVAIGGLLTMLPMPTTRISR